MDQRSSKPHGYITTTPIHTRSIWLNDEFHASQITLNKEIIELHSVFEHILLVLSLHYNGLKNITKHNINLLIYTCTN